MLRSLLGAFLVKANRTIPTESLITLLWGDAAPDGARKTVQIYVHRLRTALGEPGRILAESGGYQLRLTPEELDSEQFGALVARAQALSKEDHRQAADLYREALNLWRGSAYEDLTDHPLMLDEARRLDEERMHATSELIELRLRLGHHEDLIPQLVSLNEHHPFREDLCAHLMLALYRAGRQAESLEVYHKARRCLGEELGLEPGPRLKQLQGAILRSDPDLELTHDGRRTAVVPRELPSAPSGFTGREAQLAALDRTLQSESSGPVPIALVTGSGGVGKTALALHWAQQNTDQFPDGQLFIDLRGYATGARIRPIEALTALLRSLGVPPRRIPIDVGEAAALFRSQTAGRRVLVVLDNARSADEVRNMLPGTSSCAVIVTSRDRLGGLVAREGAARVSLDALSADEAHALIARLHGRDVATKDEVAALASACAYLPLALRIAIAYLLDHPHQTITDLIVRLRRGGRLGTLAVLGDDTTAVRNAFSLSYQEIPSDAQLVFRRLGLVPCPTYTLQSAAMLAGISLSEAALLLERLAEAHLISHVSADRYEIHDLIREYAAERCVDEDSELARQAAIDRLSYDLLAHITGAGKLLYPSTLTMPQEYVASPVAFSASNDALIWLDNNQANITATVRHLVQIGNNRIAWLIADQMRGYFNLRRQLVDWLTVGRAGLVAARAADTDSAKAAMFLHLGHAYGVIGRHDLAIKNLSRAVKMSKRCSWPECEAAALGNLGVLKALAGRPNAAAPMMRKALTLWRKAGHTQPRSTILLNLAYNYCHIGDLLNARSRCDEALSAASETGDPNHAGYAILGKVHCLAGRYETGINMLRQGIPLLRSAGNRSFEASASIYLSNGLLDLRQLDEAGASASEALRLARDISTRDTIVAGLVAVGRYLHTLCDDNAANRALREAVEIATRTTTNIELVYALVMLARNQMALGEGSAAAQSAEQGIEMCEIGGLRLCYGEALTVLGQVHYLQGDAQKALALVTTAIAIQKQTGYAFGEAEARGVLALIHPDRQIAAEHAEAARWIYDWTGAKPPRLLIA